MSCFQTNDARAALAIGNVQVGEPLGLSSGEKPSPGPEPGAPIANRKPDDAPQFQAIIKTSSSDSGGFFSLPGEITGDGIAYLNLIAVAYQTPSHRVISKAPEIDGRYKVSVLAPRGREDLLYPIFQQMVESTFGVRAHRETRDMDVFVLRMRPERPGGLRRSQAEKSQHWFMRGRMHAEKQPVSVLADVLENFLDRAVVDETGLEGEYDWEFSYSHADEKSVVKAVQDDLGLEVVPATRPIEVLVVDQPALETRP
jgi:uncharacterized protein (TIGR03435 family)